MKVSTILAHNLYEILGQIFSMQLTGWKAVHCFYNNKQNTTSVVITFAVRVKSNNLLKCSRRCYTTFTTIKCKLECTFSEEV